MNWILFVVFIFILLALLSFYNAGKRRRKTLHDLKYHWHKPKSNDEFPFYLIEKYFKNNHRKKEAFHIISNQCATDIDFNKTFKIIDRTRSKIGQQFLYYKLRTIENQKKLSAFKQLTFLFENDNALRLKTQLALTKINHDNGYYFEDLVTSNPIKKPKIIGLVYLLSALSLTFLVLAIFFPIFFIFLIPIVIANLFFHYKNKLIVSDYMDGISQLPKTLNVAKSLLNLPEIKRHITDTSFIKDIETIQLKTRFISFEKNVDNEFVILFWLISEFIKILFNLEYLIFYRFIDAITKKQKALEKLFHFIGEIDAAQSTALLKASTPHLCEPQFVDEKKLIVKEIIHPLVADCVPNDICLMDNSLLLTGSNMSGKTTFIRTISINSILAQTLNICFAKAYIAPFFKLYSSIRITDNLLKNTSYYLEEVLTIKKLIESSTDAYPCLFVLDEIFKGTNTIERIASGKAILSYLNQGNNMVLVSTHDIELTDILSQENFDLFHFSEQINNNQLVFDHKLKKGKLQTRNAIKILELYNYPKQIISDAKATEEIIIS